MIDLLINSWTLCGVAVTGLLFTGRKKKVGWLILFGVQCMWIVYGVMKNDLGFMAGGALFATLNGRNYLLWRRDDRVAERERVDA